MLTNDWQKLTEDSRTHETENDAKIKTCQAKERLLQKI